MTVFATFLGFSANAETTVPFKSPLPVTPDNFTRAESDLYFHNLAKDGSFESFVHKREPSPIDEQLVIRLNRDTLYSSLLIDLDAGPVTVTLPDAGNRFISLQVINEDQYTRTVEYKPGDYTFSKDDIGTRYALFGIRILVNPEDEKDLKEVHALQDALKFKQEKKGSFEVPVWDSESQNKIRKALLELGTTLPDTKGTFGWKDQVDPVRFLIGSAMAWGGNPEKDALYLNITPHENDGKIIHKLTVKDVPVDGFWSISLYNPEGYYVANKYNAYSLNNLTAKKDKDGLTTIQFGGCDGKVPNCLPIMKGWNYMVRLYRPHEEILNGTWKFPEAVPVK